MADSWLVAILESVSVDNLLLDEKISAALCAFCIVDVGCMIVSESGGNSKSNESVGDFVDG